MFCPKCGAQNEDDSKFCQKCGSKIVTIQDFDDKQEELAASCGSPATKWKCPKCGQSVYEEEFCPECGSVNGIADNDASEEDTVVNQWRAMTKSIDRDWSMPKWLSILTVLLGVLIVVIAVGLFFRGAVGTRPGSAEDIAISFVTALEEYNATKALTYVDPLDEGTVKEEVKSICIDREYSISLEGGPAIEDLSEEAKVYYLVPVTKESNNGSSKGNIQVRMREEQGKWLVYGFSFVP
ncbi:MAG: zinc ribbon domain-containing protein [Actinomycetota bacterium]